MFNHDAVNFQVEKFPLHAWDMDEYMSTGTWTSGLLAVSPEVGMGLRRTDTKEPLAIVSESYNIEQYDTIVDGVEYAIRKSPLDLTGAEFRTNVYGNGSQLMLEATFPAHSMQIGHSKLHPQLFFRTSHNRTWKHNGSVGFFDMHCYNGQWLGDKITYITNRHSKNFNVDEFMAKLGNALEYIAGEGAEEMRRWYVTPVTREQAINLFSKTLAKHQDNVTRKNKPNQVRLSNLMKTFDEENRHIHGKGVYEKYGMRDQGSLWSAYNAATAWSTHTKSREGAASQNALVGREEKVRKMLNSTEWASLALAA